MEIAKINSSGRLTIPIAFRKKYNLKKGTKIVFIEHGEGIMIQTLDKNYFTNLAGLLGEKNKMLKSLMIDKVIEHKL
jgi:AbrB family looped-hinge helix DNA binding protein